MSDLTYVLTSYEDAMRQRREAREAAYQAYKARRIAIQTQRARADMLLQIYREDAQWAKTRIVPRSSLLY